MHSEGVLKIILALFFLCVLVAHFVYPHYSDQKVKENVLTSLLQRTTFVFHLLEPKTVSMTGRTAAISIVAAVAVNQT